MSNLSFLDDEAFGDLVPMNASDYFSPPSIIEKIWFHLGELIKLVICTSSAGASIFLLYIIFKFNRIRKKSNIFLMHYTIACIIDMLLIPLIHFFALVFYDGARWKILCMLFVINDTACTLVFAFGAAIGLYWFIRNFKIKWLNKYFLILFTITFYLISFINICINIAECFPGVSLHSGHIQFIVYCLALVVVVVINFGARNVNSDKRNYQKTKYELLISNYVVLCYLPLFVSNYIYNFDLHIKVYMFLAYFVHVPQFFAYSGPIIVVYLLGEKNKYFKAAYKATFKKSIRDYSEDDMNQDSEDEDVGTQQDSNQTNSIHECFNSRDDSMLI